MRCRASGVQGAHTPGKGGMVHNRSGALKYFARQCRILQPVLGDAPARYSSPAALSAQRCGGRAVRLLCSAGAPPLGGLTSFTPPLVNLLSLEPLGTPSGGLFLWQPPVVVKHPPPHTHTL